MDYISLLTSSCRGMPRFSGLVGAVVKQCDDLIAVVGDITAAFSLGHAVGEQLDLLGKGFGISRPPGMTDEDYEKLIRMKLARWRWDGANDTVEAVIAEMDPGGVVTDNGDGTVTVTAAGALPDNVSELYPIPAGIGIA